MAHTAQFVNEMREKLLAEKERIERDLGVFAKKNPNVPEGDYDAQYPEYGDESDENAREIAEYTANKPLEITLEKTLRDINKALRRMEDGAYGVCKYCDNDIDEKRLRTRPTSNSCVDCKKTLTNEV